MGERKALVVGINDYPTCPLRGCCNDSEAIKDLLSNHGNGDLNCTPCQGHFELV